MSDELTRAIAEATEGRQREGTAKWPECCRDTYSLAIEEIAAALAPLTEARNVQREQRAFDRGYDKAMEGIEARVREARAEGSQVHWQYGVKRCLPQWNNGEPYIEWGSWTGHDGYRVEHTEATASHRRQVRTWPTEYGEAEEIRRG